MVIGLDEAGRGPWAGPVVAGAAWIAPDAVNALPSDLADSKILSEASRQRIYHQLKALAEDPTRLQLATASVSAADRRLSCTLYLVSCIMLHTSSCEM